jgi:hypothetical protein
VLRGLPAAVKEPVVSSFIDAMHVVFYTASAVCAVAFVISLLLREAPLRTTSAMSPAEAEPGAEPALASGVLE